MANGNNFLASPILLALAMYCNMQGAPGLVFLRLPDQAITELAALPAREPAAKANKGKGFRHIKD